jgi:transcriptional regulator with XRE-family HTH domain
MNVKEIGRLVRQARKTQGFTQKEAAGYLNVGVRFLSDLENGKPTSQTGKVIEVLGQLGYELVIIPRSQVKLLRRIKEELGEK